MKIVPANVRRTVVTRVILAWAALSLLAGTVSCFTLSCLSRETTAYCADISRAQPIGFHDIAFHLENNMAVMMILMFVFLVMGGHDGPTGSHGTNEPPTESSQPHEHDAAKQDSGNS
jgi:hypothetical protein